MTPEEAVQVHLDVKGRTLLPVHWGTFNLAYHPWDEPTIRAMTSADQKYIILVTPKVGELIDIHAKNESFNWWKDTE
jgi:L-ascorbate metabolism protein UlaG (beta-lactamase superfamily)